MNEEVFEYKSPHKKVRTFPEIVETSTTNGLTCVWSGTLTNDHKLIEYSWKFNWDELENRKNAGFCGHILTKRPAIENSVPIRVDVNLTQNNQVIEKTISNINGNSIPSVSFEYYLIPHFNYEQIFSSSEQSDAILVIEEKKLHVNKAFLSLHSEFFRALFSTNYKEGQMNEIPIKDVSYQDFGLLLSIIYPPTSFPIDVTSEKLLELADRFMMTSVIRQVEHHLLHISKIENGKMMLMADKYKLDKLLKKAVQQIDSTAKAKNIKQSPEYAGFTNKTKAALFERLVDLI